MTDRRSNPNVDEFVEDCIKLMGNDLGMCFGLLCKEYWFSQEVLSTSLKLYGHPDVTLLNQVAPSFFGLAQRLLHDSLILHVGRLCDPAGAGERECVSLDRLAQLYTSTERARQDGDDRLPGLVQQARDSAKPFLTWRNKVVAHHDWQTASSRYPDPNTVGNLKDVLKQGCECLDFVGSKFGFGGLDLQPEVDVASLLKWLRAARPAIEQQRKREDEIIQGF